MYLVGFMVGTNAHEQCVVLPRLEPVLVRGFVGFRYHHDPWAIGVGVIAILIHDIMNLGIAYEDRFTVLVLDTKSLGVLILGPCKIHHAV